MDHGPRVGKHDLVGAIMMDAENIRNSKCGVKKRGNYCGLQGQGASVWEKKKIVNGSGR